jgi:hypothetical protein
MSKMLLIEYLGFQGKGPTAKDAKRDACQRIEALHEGTWEPIIREWRSHAVLVHRDLNGWQYTFIRHNGCALRRHGACIGSGDYRETLRSAERHLADIGWTVTDPLDLFPEWFNHEEDRQEIISSRRWQLKIRELLDKGYDMERARNIPFGLESENPAEPELSRE